MQKVLEVCVDSVESAIAAREGGATRIELCANLVIGGTTPSAALLKSVKKETGLPVNVLLRPRFGDFLYTEREFNIMLEDAAGLLEAGADAIVSGCLTKTGDLDTERMAQLISLCKKSGKNFTLHRAFDVCREPLKALEECKNLGVNTVLTSGQAASCTDGLPLIKQLFASCGDVEILVGAGVNAAAIRCVRDEIPTASSFHMSGKVVLESEMEYRKLGVPMGLPNMSEFEIWRTDEAQISAAWKELNRNEMV